MKVGRIIGTAILGMLFLLFVAVDLLAFGVIPLNSPVITVLPIIGLVLGGVLGALASRRATATVTAGGVPTAPAPQPTATLTPPPMAAPPPPPPPPSSPPVAPPPTTPPAGPADD